MARKQLDKRFSIKIAIVGSDDKEEKGVRVLNRVIRCTTEGWEYEANQRHADILVKELDMEGKSGRKHRRRREAARGRGESGGVISARF